MRVLITGTPGGGSTYERMVDAMIAAAAVAGIEPVFMVGTTANRSDHFAAKYAKAHGLTPDLYFSPIGVPDGRAQRNARMVAESEAAVILHDPGVCPDIDDLVRRCQEAGFPLWLG